jgi:hypothetical protein
VLSTSQTSSDDTDSRDLPELGELSGTVVKRIIRHILGSHSDEQEKVKALRQGSTAIFEYLCDLLAIDHHTKTTRKELFESILESVSTVGTQYCMFVHLKSILDCQ